MVILSIAVILMFVSLAGLWICANGAPGKGLGSCALGSCAVVTFPEPTRIGAHLLCGPYVLVRRETQAAGREPQAVLYKLNAAGSQTGFAETGARQSFESATVPPCGPGRQGRPGAAHLTLVPRRNRW